MKRLSVGLIVSFLFAVSTGQVFADVSQPGDLKGVTSVKCIVEKLKTDVQTDGLDESALKTETELHLRSAGLKVDPNSRYLIDVSVNPIKMTSTGGYVYSIDVNLSEPASIRGHVQWVKSWSSQGVGYCPPGSTSNIIGRVTAILDTFANEWLRDNPK